MDPSRLETIACMLLRRLRIDALFVASSAVALLSCKKTEPALEASSWPEADAMFARDNRYVGGDGAYTIDLGGERTLWLFGDTFLATEASGNDAAFLRNSAGIQIGRDPSRASFQLYWGSDDDGGPRSFIAQDGDRWFWPGGGARVGNSVLIFYQRLKTPDDDPSGFEGDGGRAIAFQNVDDEPSAWTSRDVALPASGDVSLGNGAFVDGDWLYVYGEKGKLHDVYLARWPLSSVSRLDLTAPQWWCGERWDGSCDPTIVVPWGAPELSVQRGGELADFVMLQTEGFGSATLAYRTAPAPEGPWSAPVSFFRPPESRDGHTDVYAGKGHASLIGADFVVTYVASDSYRPRFVRATVR